MSLLSYAVIMTSGLFAVVTRTNSCQKLSGNESKYPGFISPKSLNAIREKRATLEKNRNSTFTRNDEEEYNFDESSSDEESECDEWN